MKINKKIKIFFLYLFFLFWAILLLNYNYSFANEYKVSERVYKYYERKLDYIIKWNLSKAYY